jgi:hypothetical protein
MNLQLTDEQRQALASQGNRPVPVVDPATNARYVLLPAEAYQRLCALAPADANAPDQAGAVEAPPYGPGIPPGIQRSKDAFLRDLPALLQIKKRQGQWVAYHGEERLGFARTQAELDQLCFRRGLKLVDFYVGWIGPQMEEEIDASEWFDK